MRHDHSNAKHEAGYREDCAACQHNDQVIAALRGAVPEADFVCRDCGQWASNGIHDGGDGTHVPVRGVVPAQEPRPDQLDRRGDVIAAMVAVVGDVERWRMEHPDAPWAPRSDDVDRIIRAAASPAAPETPHPGHPVGQWACAESCFAAAPETRKSRVVITESEPDFAVAEKVYDDEEPG